MTITRALPRWVLAVLFTASVALTLWPVPTTFNIVAHTETLTARLSEDHRFHWYLRDAEVRFAIGRPGGPTVLGSEGFESFTGSILVESGAVVTFERIADGALEVGCRATDGGQVATLFSQGQKLLRTFDEQVVLRLDRSSASTGEGRTNVFPVAGSVTLGRELGEQVGPRPALLKGGTISMLGHSFFSRERFDGGSVELDPGDAVGVTVDGVLMGAGERHAGTAPARGPFYGLVLVDERPALTAVFRVVGTRATVSRFASQGYDASVGAFTRITRDPFTQTLWGVFATLVAVVAFFREGGRKDG